MNANCPFPVARPIHAPTPTTLQTTNGRQGGLRPLRDRVHAIQLTAKEAMAELDVVIGMY